MAEHARCQTGCVPGPKAACHSTGGSEAAAAGARSKEQCGYYLSTGQRSVPNGPAGCGSQCEEREGGEGVGVPECDLAGAGLGLLCHPLSPP